MSNQSIRSIVSSHPENALHISMINQLDIIDEHVNDVVEFIESSKGPTKIVIDEDPRVPRARDRNRIYDAILRSSRMNELVLFNLRNMRPEFESRLYRWIILVLCETKVEKILISDVTLHYEGIALVARALRRSKALKEINLMALDIGETTFFIKALTRTKPHSSFKRLGIYQCRLSETALSVLENALRRRYSPFEVLKIQFWHHDSWQPRDSIPRLLNALATNKTLKQFVVADFKLDCAEAVAAAGAHLLRENHSLRSLWIIPEDDPYYDRRIMPIDVTAIAQALSVNLALKEIILTYWGINDHGLKCLCEAVIANKTTEVMELKCNNVGGMEGMTAIRTLLSSKTALKSLALSGNQIGEMISYLSEPLEENDTLEVLRLFDCNISDEGAVELGRSLRKNKFLRELDLGGNAWIGHEGMSAIVDAVKVHLAITKVNFENAMPVQVKDELDYYLELNKGPRKLLHANPPLPSDLWPLAFERAGTSQRVKRCNRFRTPDVLYFLVKAKVDLFAGIPSKRGQKRGRID